MADYIPFVNTPEDCFFLKKYSDSHIIRVTSETLDRVESLLPKDMPLWVDGGVDGYEHHLKTNSNPLPKYIEKYINYEILADSNNFKKPIEKDICAFVDSVMNMCKQAGAKWITVPLLPMVDDNSRNKINTALSKAAGKWRIKTQYDGQIVLPLIFTNYQQLSMKTKWKPRLDSAVKWYDYANADIVWTVDSSLPDQKGTSNFRKRFDSLIDFHRHLRSEISKAKIIAGPYWGMNLILWARNYVNYPAISLGTGYQYYLSGAPYRRRGKVRLALSPLRRCVVASRELRKWYTDAMTKLNSKDCAFSVFKQLSTQSIIDRDVNRNQITDFYKKWFHEIQETPPSERALALYQDLSSAYVLGKQLPTLPPSGSTARRPERVAESFMLSCL